MWSALSSATSLGSSRTNFCTLLVQRFFQHSPFLAVFVTEPDRHLASGKTPAAPLFAARMLAPLLAEAGWRLFPGRRESGKRVGHHRGYADRRVCHSLSNWSGVRPRLYASLAARSLARRASTTQPSVTISALSSAYRA
jgi:hypothetical protein